MSKGDILHFHLIPSISRIEISRR